MNARHTAKRSPVKGHARFSERIPASTPRNLLKSAAQSFLIVLIVLIVSALLVSAALYTLADPNRYIAPASMTLIYIASLLGGFVSVKRYKGSPLLCGLLFAVMMLVATLIVSLVLPNTLSFDRPFPLEIGLRGIAAALSVVGALIGSGQRKKTHVKRKRR